MDKLLILTTSQAYARSATSATKSTAITSDILNDGAIGIYGAVANDATTAGNSNKTCLLAEAASAGAGVTSPFIFRAGGGNYAQIVQGAANQDIVSYMIDVRSVVSVNKQTYSAAINEVSFIGFNGVSGAFNNITITQNADATVLAVLKEQNAGDQISQRESYTALTTGTDGAYELASKIVTDFNTKSSSPSHTAFVVSNGTYTLSTTTSGTGTLTQGSATVTFATAIPANGWVAAVGDYISIAQDAASLAVPAAAATNINGVVYKVIAVTATTLTLDRPYRGITAVVTEANIKTGYISKVTPTLFGIKLVVNQAGTSYEYARQGLLQYADLTNVGTAVAGCLAQGASQGFGTGASIVKLENSDIWNRGQIDSTDIRMKQLPKFANSATTYDFYTIVCRNATVDSGFASKSIYSNIGIAVPVGYTGQAVLESVLGSLFTQAAINFTFTAITT